MTNAERYDVALRTLEAILACATHEDLTLTAKVLAVENAAYRSAFGALPVPPILPLLVGTVQEHEAVFLADGMEHLTLLLRIVRSTP